MREEYFDPLANPFTGKGWCELNTDRTDLNRLYK
jgi:hypothetical protein